MRNIHIAALLLAAALTLCPGCGKGAGQDVASQNAKIEPVLPETARSFAEIAKSGELRVLTMRASYRQLPRDCSFDTWEQLMVDRVAERIGVKARRVYVKDFKQLLAGLDNGSGDLAAHVIDITPERQDKYSFSVPIARSSHLVVTAADNVAVNAVEDLAGQKVFVRPGTSFWGNVPALQKLVPGALVTSADPGVDESELIELTSEGKTPAMFANSVVVAPFLSVSPTLKTIYRFPITYQVGWAMPKGANLLAAAVDKALRDIDESFADKRWKGGLKAIERHKTLRVIIDASPLLYYAQDGALKGFEYDLASQFAASLGVNLVVVVPPCWQEAIELLEDGRGDLIASTMSVFPDRERLSSVKLCAPYLGSRAVLVTRGGPGTPKRPADLAGMDVIVEADSFAEYSLRELQRREGVKFNIVHEQSGGDYASLLKLSTGKVQALAADEILFPSFKALFPTLVAAFPFGQNAPFAWMARAEDDDLREAVSAFFANAAKSGFLEAKRKQYFQFDTPEAVTKFRQAALDIAATRGFAVSPYDPLIKKYAQLNRFPWLLVASHIYEKSRFNPDEVGQRGEVGLTGVPSHVARRLECDDPFVPAQNLKTGLAYLKMLHDRMAGDLAEDDRVKFSIAAFVGGYTHLLDARRLAKTLEYNANRWNDNVERSYLLINDPKYAKDVRYGPCQGEFIVNCVNDIFTRAARYSQQESDAEEK